METYYINIIFLITFGVISQFFINRSILFNQYSDIEMKKIADSMNLVFNPFFDIKNDKNVAESNTAGLNSNNTLIFKRQCSNRSKARTRYNTTKIENVKNRKYKLAKKAFIVDIFATLIPFDVDKCLVRIGQVYDGGYLILDYLSANWDSNIVSSFTP